MIESWLAAVVLVLDGPAWCSGVGVAEGVVATAYHCVAEGGRPSVRWRDGHSVRGRVIARDPAHDLALVAVDRPGMAVLAVRGEDPALGERVYGLGHPYGMAAVGRLEGTLRWSVSEGVVGAVGEWFIQTDAALNPGSSGGPVVDVEGRVVGLASRKLRADNLAFLSRGAHLAALLHDRPRGPALGGAYGVGPAGWVGEGSWLGVEGWASVRDRAVVRVGGGVGAWTGASPWLGTASLEGRARLGVASGSVTVEAGGGVAVERDGARPMAVGHLGVGRVAVGAAWTPSGWLGTMSVAWPGRLGVW